MYGQVCGRIWKFAKNQPFELASLSLAGLFPWPVSIAHVNLVDPTPKLGELYASKFLRKSQIVILGRQKSLGPKFQNPSARANAVHFYALPTKYPQSQPLSQHLTCFLFLQRYYATHQRHIRSLQFPHLLCPHRPFYHHRTLHSSHNTHTVFIVSLTTAFSVLIFLVVVWSFSIHF